MIRDDLTSKLQALDGDVELAQAKTNQLPLQCYHFVPR